jgi:hypothetical protein
MIEIEWKLYIMDASERRKESRLSSYPGHTAAEHRERRERGTVPWTT